MLLPKVLSIVLLLISIAMLVPLGIAVIHMGRGTAVPTMQWVVPLAILATAAVMMWLLTRRSVPIQLYVVAFSLWLVTAGYFFYLTEFR